MKYRVGINSGNVGKRKTIKIVACSYQSIFENAQTAITEGQFVAWYQDEELLGSGVIS